MTIFFFMRYYLSKPNSCSGKNMHATINITAIIPHTINIVAPNSYICIKEKKH